MGQRTAAAALFALVALAAVASAYEPVLAKPRFREGSVFGGKFDVAARFDGTDSGYSASGGYGASLLHYDNTFKSWVTDIGDSASITSVAALPNGTVFFGFQSTVVAGVSCHYIARYDPGVGISCLGDGLGNTAMSLAFVNDELWVAGYFTSVRGKQYLGNHTFRYMAIWDGSRWKPTAYAGLDDAPSRLRVDNVGQVWAIGNWFSGTGDTSDDVLPVHVVPVHNASATCAACNSPMTLITAPYDDNKNFIWGALGQASVVVNLGTAATALAGVRIRGTKLPLYDTATFRVRCNEDGFDQSMEYWDHLSQDTSVTANPRVFRTDVVADFVDYYFTSPPTCKSLTFFFDEGPSSGKGVALTGIQLLRRRIYVDETYNPPGVTLVKNGNWTLENMDSEDPNLVGYVQPGGPRSSLKFNPNIQFDGNYEVYMEYAACSSNCLATAELLVDIPGRGALTYPVNVNHGSSDSLRLDLAPGSTLELLLPESSPSTDDLTCHFGRLTIYKQQTVRDLYLNRVAIYNPQDLSTIRRLGTPMPLSSAVYDVAFLGGNAYLGGLFSFPSDDWKASFHNIVRYSQGQFYPLALGGLNDAVVSLAVVDEKTLVVGGSFTGPYNTTAFSPRLYRVALYRDGTWEPLAGGSDQDAYEVIAINKTEIFVAFPDWTSLSNDEYSLQNTIDVYYLGHYSITDGKWKLAPALSDAPSGLAVSNKNELIVFGNIETSMESMGHNLVVLQDGHWLSLNGSLAGRQQSDLFGKWVNTGVYYKGELVVGGTFSSPLIKEDQTTILSCVARYNATSKRWEALKERVASSCQVDDMVVVGDNLWFVGAYEGVTTPRGDGRNSEPATSNLIFAWNGTDFFLPTKPLPTASTAYIYKIDAVSRGGRDYVVVAGYIPGKCHHICVWDGEEWHALGLGVNSVVLDMRIIGDYVVAGGDFEYAGGISVPYIAKFDMGTGVWTPLESPMASPQTGPDNSVYSIRGDSLDSLVIAGSFSSGDNYGLARFDGNSFVYFGSLDSSSLIHSIELVPTDNLPSNELLPGGQGLLVMGSLYLVWADVFANVALFDGVNWHPILVASDDQPYQYPSSLVRFYLEGPQVGLEAYQIALISVFSVIGFFLIVFLLVFFLVILPKRRAGK